MTSAALGLALAAALVHACWNVLVGGARDPRASAAVAMIASVVVGLPLAAATWDLQSGVVPWAIASALLELAYIMLLAAAYRRVAVTVVYPIARGAAPVLVLCAAVATGVATSAGQLAGVLLVGCGIAFVAGGREPARPGDVGMALAVAASIAGYTLVDKHGLRYGSPVPYLEAVMVWPAIAYTGWVAMRDGTAGLRAAARSSAVVAGVGMFAAYALALAALQRAPAASVSAVRESSIVVAPLIVAALARTRPSGRAVAGAAVVAAGVVLVALA
jgi:drug/metabolite transporter (DMT)-like permease